MAEQTIFVGPLDRVLNFRTVPALDRLTPAQLGAIAQHAREEFFPRGGFLIRRDRPVDAFYIVIDGRVSVTGVGRQAHEAGPGDAVGFHHLLARSTTGIEARADADTLALRLDWEAQLDVCEQHFPVLLQYVRYLAQRSIDEFGRLPAETRLGAGADRDAVPAERRLNLAERLQALHRAPAFPSSSMDALSELARHLVEERFAAGQSIWRDGDPGGSFLLVARGTARCQRATPPHRFFAGPAAVLGMEEALSGQTRWYDATGDQPFVALRIGLEPFLDVLEDHFEMAIDFTSRMARELLALLEREPDGGEERHDRGGV